MAVFLTVAVAGQAMAYFEDNHVTMFAYTLGGNEVGYDLGDTASIDFTAVHNVLAPAGTFDWLAETGATDLGAVNVGIYAGSGSAYEAWFVTTLANTEPVISMPNVNNFWNGITAIRGHYGTDTRKDSGTYDVPGSYGQAMGAGGSYGAFHGGDIALGELNLADASGLSDLYLYRFTYPGTGSVLTLDPGATTLHKAAIDIGLDGSVTLNPVPIPGAAILLGSGLLGLVGIRRRKLA